LVDGDHQVAEATQFGVHITINRSSIPRRSRQQPFAKAVPSLEVEAAREYDHNASAE
jgi:hypothetical protein